jgi:hypothetical protein
MAAPTWSVGQILTASDVNTWFVDIVRNKPTDEGPITTTTLQNDNDLILPLAAGAAYELDGYLAASGASISTADIKTGFTAPSGASFRFTTFGYSLTSNAVVAISAARSSGAAPQGVDGSAASPVIIKGWVTTTATSGNFTLQWAENTGNASGTSVLAGSWLKARRIG